MSKEPTVEEMVTAQRIYQRAYRSRNREKIRLYKKQWRLKNLDRVRLCEKQRRQKNRDKIRSDGRARMAKWRELHPEENAVRVKKWNQDHGEYYKLMHRKAHRANPEKSHARNTVQGLIRAGKIIKPETCCICHKPRVEGHHPDYSKPAEVKWVCHSCHFKIHGMNKRLSSQEARP